MRNRNRDRNPANRDGLALSEAERELMRTTLGAARAVDMLHVAGLPSSFDGRALGEARHRRQVHGVRVAGFWRYSANELSRFAQQWLQRHRDQSDDSDEIRKWREEWGA